MNVQLSSQEQQMSTEDTLLSELRDAIDPIVTKIDEDYDTERAIFLIAAKENYNADGEPDGVESYFDCAGDYSIVQEALYNILVDKLDQHSPELFEALREVIRQIEEERGIEPDEIINVERVLH